MGRGGPVDRFRFGAPRCTTSVGEGWSPVRVPSGWPLQAFALVVGLAMALTLGWVWAGFARTGFLTLGSTERPLVVVVLVALMPIHEFVHACAYPGGPFGRSVHWGCHWPGCWTAYDGDLTRERRVLAKLFPVIVLSVIPFAATFATRSVSLWMACLVLGNIIIASADLILATALVWQIPRKAVVRDSCDGTFWRPA